jgi:galactokinase/mevalonate kinase-like predicted kinase
MKEQICKELGIEYLVSKRVPHGQLPARSTTALREECRIPYRIDIAGGWLDQPNVSKQHPGPVVTICIEPDYEFNDRSGMSTSSRKKAIELWQVDIPAGDKETLAKTLFCFENPPGTKYISGSQDSLGITLPGLNKFYYDGDYWPSQIDKILDDEILSWLEKRLWLIPLYPRKGDYDVLADTNITSQYAKELGNAAQLAWNAILSKDVAALGRGVLQGFEAQIAMFPHMVNEEIFSVLSEYQDKALGWKLSGAGGGGYLIFVSETPIENSMQIRIRRGE